jgi:hypothetical protein
MTVPGDLAGRKIRCLSCGTILIVPGLDAQLTPEPEQASRPQVHDYDEPGPRRRRPQRRRLRERGAGRAWLLPVGIVAGVVLLLVAGILVYRLTVGGNVLTGDNGHLSPENVKRFEDRLKEGNLSLDEAEQIIGPSRRATELDLRQAYAHLDADTPPRVAPPPPKETGANNVPVEKR